MAGSELREQDELRFVPIKGASASPRMLKTPLEGRRRAKGRVKEAPDVIEIANAKRNSQSISASAVSVAGLRAAWIIWRQSVSSLGETA